ncbi:zinc finger protein hangover-like isoform X2 [Armigeres subalbatus]
MDRYCRTCYRTNAVRKFDINTVSQVTNERIGDMVIYCLQIEINPYDLLPQTICEACLNSLNAMFLFRKRCYNSDTELKKILKYAPPEHVTTVVPNMEHELDLIDAMIPISTESQSIENIDSCSKEQNSSSKTDQPAPHIDTLETTSETSHVDNLSENPVVVERYTQKLFECEQCDYRSSFKCNVIRHQQCRDHIGIRITIPSGKTPLKAVKKLQCCDECGFQTFIRSNLLSHQRVWKHTMCSTRDVEVKRILEKCPTCPHCGVQRANLQAHMAQWCKVLRGRKKQHPPVIVNQPSENTSTDEVPAIEMKFEIDDTNGMVS